MQQFRVATQVAVRPFEVLLVEDDQDHAELVRRCLQEHLPAAGLHHVSDGQQALDYLHRRGSFADPASSPRPDLVLLDLRLPRVDGLTVLRQIKEPPELRNVPVVVLTTSDAIPDVTAAYRAYVNSYLVKPMDFARFDALIRQIGLYWVGRNRHP
jgi:two-component system, response regulator